MTLPRSRVAATRPRRPSPSAPIDGAPRRDRWSTNGRRPSPPAVPGPPRPRARHRHGPGLSTSAPGSAPSPHAQQGRRGCLLPSRRLAHHQRLGAPRRSGGPTRWTMVLCTRSPRPPPGRATRRPDPARRRGRRGFPTSRLTNPRLTGDPVPPSGPTRDKTSGSSRMSSGMVSGESPSGPGPLPDGDGPETPRYRGNAPARGSAPQLPRRDPDPSARTPCDEASASSGLGYVGSCRRRVSPRGPRRHRRRRQPDEASRWSRG